MVRPVRSGLDDGGLAQRSTPPIGLVLFVMALAVVAAFSCIMVLLSGSTAAGREVAVVICGCG